MTEDSAWVRDKLMQHERELGQNAERQRATDNNLQSLRSEMQDGFRTSREETARQIGHVRGEVKAGNDKVDALRSWMQDELQKLRNEEKKRDEDIIAAQEEAITKAHGERRVIFLALGALIVGGQQLIEHLPMLLGLLP